MDTKCRIKEMMEERNWTVYELSKRSGLAQTTLANMWKRNTEPTIPTLRAICNGFGITMAQFFAEGEFVELTADQQEFFNNWAALSVKQKEMLMDLVRSMK
ncbi:MAG: helix-turn-helix transcriptional regulator [Clostridia bacterium]|nr:helix-turn-helix transcriptional regulator [Clostridia bacterium]MBR6809520.1 helix-turn-helix transcriptional regulator [Clostridia bacterium]